MHLYWMNYSAHSIALVLHVSYAFQLEAVWNCLNMVHQFITYLFCKFWFCEPSYL